MFTGLSPFIAEDSTLSQLIYSYKFNVRWPIPLSLTTTYGVSVDFFSSRYLDVSVPLVLVHYGFYTVPGFPLG